jgi:hypothetical protein
MYDETGNNAMLAIKCFYAFIGDVEETAIRIGEDVQETMGNKTEIESMSGQARRIRARLTAKNYAYTIYLSGDKLNMPENIQKALILVLAHLVASTDSAFYTDNEETLFGIHDLIDYLCFEAYRIDAQEMAVEAMNEIAMEKASKPPVELPGKGTTR